jgi:two-component system nitrate/nitrite response regulator NarL
MPVQRITTIIVEPYLLVREGLSSLMESHTYRVVCSVGSIADIRSPSIAGDGQKLVILTAQAAGNAVSDAATIRRLWPDSKIVLLFEHASPDDFQKLLASEIDGCVPLFVSQDMLIKTLDLILLEDARIIVVAGARRSSIQPAMITDQSRSERKKLDGHQSSGAESDPLPNGIAVLDTQHRKNGISAPGLHDDNNGKLPVNQTRNLPKLSEREAQILDSLVKGHANKVIARTCSITEATVKVHLKSILRKIQVANRTQAAIWALEHGHSAEDIKNRLLKATEEH